MNHIKILYTLYTLKFQIFIHYVDFIFEIISFLAESRNINFPGISERKSSSLFSLLAMDLPLFGSRIAALFVFSAHGTLIYFLCFSWWDKVLVLTSDRLPINAPSSSIAAHQPITDRIENLKHNPEQVSDRRRPNTRTPFWKISRKIPTDADSHPRLYATFMSPNASALYQLSQTSLSPSRKRETVHVRKNNEGCVTFYRVFLDSFAVPRSLGDLPDRSSFLGIAGGL